MRVTIDREECTSCAVCWTGCPEVFEEDPDDGWSRIVEASRRNGYLARGEPPDSLRDGAAQTAADCPVSIIHVEG